MKNKISCLLFVAFLSALSISAQPVSLKKILNVKKLAGTTVHYKGSLYSIYNGALYNINLSTGEYAQVGNTLYNNTRFFFALNNRLFIIEKDGSMTQIDRSAGTWSVVSTMGSWTMIDRVIVVGNNFYSTQNGALYHHPTMSDRIRKQVGDANFFDLGLLMYTDTTLHSIIGGNLYQISLVDGKWKKLGSGKNWKNCKLGAVVNNKVYTIESGDVLFETSLPDGSKKQLDNSHFTGVRDLFGDSGKLYCITADYDLCEIVPGEN